MIVHTASKMLPVLERLFGGGLHFAQMMTSLQWGQICYKKQRKFSIYVREYEETGHVDEVVLWVLSRVMREPIAILLKGKFWITMVEEDIGDVQMLSVYGGEGCFIPIHCMTDEEMPDKIQGD